MPPTVLMVCEKPSIAQSIANSLSRSGFSTRHSGRLTIHEFDRPFLNYPHANYKVLGLFGHIYSTDFPSQYNDWNKINPAELFDAPVRKIEEKGKQVSGSLIGEARGCDYVVLCLDCDREGENICFEVLSIIQPYLAKRGGKQIYRAHFSAVTESDMRRAMDTLTDPNENEAMAVDVRQELDLKVGVAFTRYQTLYFRGKYGDLNSETISYGPCQV